MPMLVCGYILSEYGTIPKPQGEKAGQSYVTNLSNGRMTNYCSAPPVACTRVFESCIIDKPVDSIKDI